MLSDRAERKLPPKCCGHFALTAAEQVPGVQEAESLVPAANHHTPWITGHRSFRKLNQEASELIPGTKQGWAEAREWKSALKWGPEPPPSALLQSHP